MQKIKLLPPYEAQKIAAGEVIERPANIVKELLENSIDAGATRITIYLQEGGHDLIRVVDNGCGMNNEDALICFDRHATSKLNTFDELNTITTFGFRGEALASIAAISKITLITKEETATCGVNIQLQSDIQKKVQPIACTTGTDLSVADLFYQMPARKKFLKAPPVESRHILQLIHAFCLNYPTIHFSVYIDGHETLNCPPVTELIDRCAQLWGHNIHKSLLDIHETRQKPAIELHGIIGNQHLWKYDRSSLFIFVNKRWVKNQKLGTAILKGYQNVLPHGRFPVACLFITVDQNTVDINVHPRKEEVVFMQPRLIEQLIEKTVQTTLEQHCTHLKKTNPLPFAISHHTVQPSTIDHSPYIFSSLKERPFLHAAHQSSPTTSIAQPHHAISQMPLQSAIESPIPAQNFDQSTQEQISENYLLIGQFHNTYVLIQHNENLILIDQHAAHERILYELFANRFSELATTRLIFPQTIMIGSHDLPLITQYETFFTDNGIMLEPFGQDQLIIHALPTHLKNVDLTQLVHQVIGWCKEYAAIEKKEFFNLIHEKLHAQMACKAAIKAGDELTIDQMHDLLGKLYKTANRFSCPHGRPTSYSLSLPEIERKFKRR